jgi:hypothetical protein
MKTQNIILSVILMLVLVLSACREVKVTTKINRDGSFTRVILVTGDSAEVQKKTDLPFPVDDTWEMTFGRDTSDTTKFLVTWTKTFRNSDELNAEIQNDTSFYKNIQRDITVKKRFGFFYTYLSFREVYKCMNTFNYLNYKDFMTEEDLQWFNGLKMPLTSVDSTRKNEAEDKADTFFQKSAAAEIGSILKEGIKRLNNPALDTAIVTTYLDAIVNEEKFILWNGENIIDYYHTKSGIDAFLLLKEMQPYLFADYDKKMADVEYILAFQDYKEEVQLPGLITGTNSSIIKGNQVSWQVESSSFFITDFEMYAESRVINYWAFIVAGIVVFGLVVLLVVKAFRR